MSEGRIHIGDLKPADIALLKQVASEAAEQAVSKTFIAMGIDPSRPLDAQADMLFLRLTRKRCEGVGFRAILTVVGIVVAGGAGMLWVGFKTSLKALLPFALPLIIVLALAAVALAQHNHAQHHASYNSWVNKADNGCCNNQDCGELTEENERDTPAGTVEVRIEGEWCPVLPHHYLKHGNAPNWSTSHVCVQKLYGMPAVSACARLLCFQPRPGI